MFTGKDLQTAKEVYQYYIKENPRAKPHWFGHWIEDEISQMATPEKKPCAGCGHLGGAKTYDCKICGDKDPMVQLEEAIEDLGKGVDHYPLYKSLKIIHKILSQ